MNMFDDLIAQRGLSLDRLWVFDKIASADCSLIRAADKDIGRAAQFARQKSELEKFFGASLTRKVGRDLRLTREGEALLGIVREAFLRLVDFRAQCSRLPKHFSIGAGDSLLHWLVIPRLAELQTSLKDYSFSLHNLQNAEIINGLLDLSLDFGLVRTTEAVEPLMRVVLGAKTYALYAPRALLPHVENAKATGKELLGSLPLAAQSKQTHFEREFEKATTGAGIRLSVSLYCETVPELVRALKTERYAAVLHAFASQELDPSRFQQIPLPFLNKLSPQIALVWHPRLLKIRGEAAEKLKGLLSEALRFTESGAAASPSKEHSK